MKKIIALAAVALFVSACDSGTKEEPGGTPTIRYALVTGRNIDFDTANGGAADGPFVGTATGTTWNITGVTPSRATYGRVLVVTTNVLLNGATIEATPQTCLPAANWLTVTTTATLTAGGTWYTCYYPSSATTDDGASVFIYYSTVAPGTATASQPIRAGEMTAGDYTFDGTIKSKSGADLVIDVNVTVVP